MGSIVGSDPHNTLFDIRMGGNLVGLPTPNTCNVVPADVFLFDHCSYLVLLTLY